MESAFGKIFEITVGPIFTFIGRQIGYVSGCRENIEKLEERLDALKIKNRNIQIKMDAPEICRDSVWPEVSKWSKKADEIEAETLRFLREEVKNKEPRCLNGRLPNVVTRYRLGRKAVKKAKVVADHETEGKKFEGAAVITYPAPTPNLRRRHGYADYQSFESRKTAYDEIMTALSDTSSHVIGICGMGGVGKTTMVIEVGNRAKDHMFEEVAFAVVSRDPTVANIQKDLASQLNMPPMNDDGTESTRADGLCKRLTNGKRILVILDDVWEELDLKRMGIPFEDGVTGCKILFTARNRTLPANKWIDIGVLVPEEAWKLFGEKVGNTISPDMEEVAKNVCNECGGLPIAIIAVAAALKNKKSKGRWDFVLEQLKTSKLEKLPGVDKKVRVCLEVSYKQLESEQAKSCFLICSLFPEDFDIPVESLVRLGRGMGMVDDETTLRMARSGTGWLVDELKDHCLLLKGKDNEHVKMHDVVRDVAISIASEGHLFLTGENVQQWPQKKTYDRYGVISLTFDEDIPELPSGFECQKLHTIMLKCKPRYPWARSVIRNPDAVFGKMRKLQVIAMREMKISSLPPSLSSLDDLRVLCLEGCDLDDISSVGELKKLEMLILGGSKIDALPVEVGDLTCLKLLDLKNCNHLKIIPPNVLRRLSKLEELILPLTYGTWEEESANLGEELKALTGIESLEVYVRDLGMLPPEAGFPWDKLTNFKISVGEYGGWETEEQFEPWKNAVKLEGIRVTGGISILLKRAEAIYMRRVQDLKSFKLQVGDNASFSHLEHLEACFCEGMQEFLATVLERPIFLETSSSKLGVLEVTGCCKSQFLLSTSAAKGLVSLHYLTIIDCENMEVVVGRSDDGTDTDVIFPQLEKLWLHNLPKLGSFYPKIKQNEDSSYVFSEPPSSRLRVLMVKCCCKLQFLLAASAANGLVSLQRLEIEDCENVEVVVGRSDDGAHGGRDQAEEKRADPDIIFPQLEDLHLQNLPKLMSFYPKKKQNEEFPFFFSEPPSSKLCVLKVIGCCNLQFFISASAARGLASLQYVRIEDCENMEAVVGSDDGAHEGRGAAEEERADTDGIFPQLQYLSFRNLPKLASFYSKVKQNEEFPCFFSVSPSRELRYLRVERCCNSQFFVSASAAKGLASLQNLTIEDCENMEAVVGSGDVHGGRGQEEEERADTDVIFPQLEELWLLKLPKLVSIYPKMKQNEEFRANFSVSPSSKLRYLRVESCCNLQFLVSASAAKGLVSLQCLHIGHSENMEAVVGSDDGAHRGRGQAEEKSADTDVIFPQLEELRLFHLPKLVSFYPTMKQNEEFPCFFSEPPSTKLRYLSVESCCNSQIFLPASAAKGLASLEKLKIVDCENVEVVVGSDDGARGGRDQAEEKRAGTDIIFPQLQILRLRNLPNLIGLGGVKGGGEHGTAVFDAFSILPNLKTIELRNLPNFENIPWEEAAAGGRSSISSPHLCKIDIWGCGRLRNLFSTPTIALAFAPNLKDLRIEGCEEMEEIVSWGFGNEVVAAAAAM